MNYHDRFDPLPNAKLFEIIAHSHEFDVNAVNAAKEILRKRNVTEKNSLLLMQIQANPHAEKFPPGLKAISYSMSIKKNARKYGFFFFREYLVPGFYIDY